MQSGPYFAASSISSSGLSRDLIMAASPPHPIVVTELRSFALQPYFPRSCVIEGYF
jgi:hypothetical protein